MQQVNRKPSSVFDSHLSRLGVAAVLKRPTVGTATSNRLFMSLLGLAPDGVYRAGKSP